MDINSTEEQQVEAIKRLWKEYGVSLVSGITLGLGGLYGWNYYSAYQVEQAQLASSEYELLTQASDEAFVEKANGFKNQHDVAGYQALLDLKIAKQHVSEGELELAASSLKRVANGDTVLANIAAIRLARVEAELGQYDNALSRLDAIQATSFDAKIAEIKGDIFVKQDDAEQAKAQYTLALEKSESGQNGVVQLKLDNLNSQG